MQLSAISKWLWQSTRQFHNSMMPLKRFTGTYTRLYSMYYRLNKENSALVPVFSSSEGVYLVDYIKSFSSQLVSLAFLVSSIAQVISM